MDELLDSNFLIQDLPEEEIIKKIILLQNALKTKQKLQNDHQNHNQTEPQLKDLKHGEDGVKLNANEMYFGDIENNSTNDKENNHQYDEESHFQITSNKTPDYESHSSAITGSANKIDNNIAKSNNVTVKKKVPSLEAIQSKSFYPAAPTTDTDSHHNITNTTTIHKNQITTMNKTASLNISQIITNNFTVASKNKNKKNPSHNAKQKKSHPNTAQLASSGQDFTEMLSKKRQNYKEIERKGKDSSSYLYKILNKKPPPAPEDPFEDPYCNIRISDRLVPLETMHNHMVGRQMVKIPNIRQNMVGNDIPGDWVTMGILTSKLIPCQVGSKEQNNNKKHSRQRKNFSVMKFYDMAETTVNLVITDLGTKMFSDVSVGTVVALLNPQILLPNETRSTLGLIVDHVDKWLALGMSMDFDICQHKINESEKCGAYFDKRKGSKCDLHELETLRKIKTGRQELVSGNAVDYNYDPNKRNIKQATNKSETHQKATYTLLNGDGITVGKKVEILQPCNFDSENNPGLLETLMMQADAGGKALRTSRGIKLSPVKTESGSSIWSHDALRKMGFNPTTGKDFIAKRTLSSSSLPSSRTASPSKSTKSLKRMNSSQSIVILDFDDDDDDEDVNKPGDNTITITQKLKMGNTKTNVSEKIGSVEERLRKKLKKTT